VTKIADTIADDSGRTEKIRTLRKRVGIGVGLGITTGLAVIGQRTGFNHDMPPIVEAGFNSMAHPAVGYLGALASVLTVDHLIKRPPNRLATAVLGGSVANAVIEVGQDIVFQAAHTIQGGSGSVASFFEGFGGSSGFESVKDYGFALAGVAIYALTERVRHKKVQGIEL
jgi:hypothetical protein